MDNQYSEIEEYEADNKFGLIVLFVLSVISALAIVGIV